MTPGVAKAQGGRPVRSIWLFGCPLNHVLSCIYHSALCFTTPLALSTLPFGSLSTLPFGPLSTLPFGPLSTLPFGPLSTLPFSPLSTLPFGPLSTLPFGSFSTLPFGSFSTLPFGSFSTLPISPLSTLPFGPLSTLPFSPSRLYHSAPCRLYHSAFCRLYHSALCRLYHSALCRLYHSALCRLYHPALFFIILMSACFRYRTNTQLPLASRKAPVVRSLGRKSPSDCLGRTALTHSLATQPCLARFVPQNRTRQKRAKGRDKSGALLQAHSRYASSQCICCMLAQNGEKGCGALNCSWPPWPLCVIRQKTSQEARRPGCLCCLQ